MGLIRFNRRYKEADGSITYKESQGWTLRSCPGMPKGYWDRFDPDLIDTLVLQKNLAGCWRTFHAPTGCLVVKRAFHTRERAIRDFSQVLSTTARADGYENVWEGLGPILKRLVGDKPLAPTAEQPERPAKAASPTFTPKEMADIATEAAEAGHGAALAATGPMMQVVERANPLDDSSPIVHAYAPCEGPCGIAWVTFRGDTCWGRWAKRELGTYKYYYGGLQLFSPLSTQTAWRHEAYCKAFAEVLKQHGIAADWNSRVD